jgi:hypothetical protein
MRKKNTEVTQTKKAEKTRPKGNAVTESGLSEEERRRMVAEAAYYKAEQRGFVGGSAEEDWLEAEAEVNALRLSTYRRKFRS